MAPRVDVGDGDELGLLVLPIDQLLQLAEQLLAARAGADHAEADAIVGAEHARRRRERDERARGRSLAEKISAFHHRLLLTSRGLR